MTSPDVDRGLSLPQLDRVFIGDGVYVRADEAVRQIMALQSQIAALEAPRPSDDEGLREAVARVQRVVDGEIPTQVYGGGPKHDPNGDFRKDLRRILALLPRMTAPVEGDLAARRMGEGGCADAQERPAWRPMESAPKDGRWLLASWLGAVSVQHVCWRDGMWRDSGSAEYSSGWFTHWMPLPAAPEAGQ